MDQEAWLAANTFYCPRLKARLTMAACEANQKLPTLRDKLGGTAPGRADKRIYKPFACEGCKGPDAAGNVAAREEEKMREKAKRVCLHCKREKPIVGRGLCGRCYPALNKSGELDKLYPAKHGGGRPAAGPAVRSEAIAAPGEKTPAMPETPVVKQTTIMPAAPVVQLDFSQHADLLDQLRDQATKEIRDLAGQIMWELKRALAIPVLPPCAYFPKRDSTEASRVEACNAQ